MSASDALVVGEAWISEHYFTTDAKNESFQSEVLKRRKVWDAEADEKRPTTRSRFTESRARLEAELAELGGYLERQSDEENAWASRPALTADERAAMRDLSAAVQDRLLDVLGLVEGHSLVLSTDGPLTRVAAVGMTDAAPLVVVRAEPVAAVEQLLAKDAPTLGAPVLLGDDAEYSSVARLVSGLFVADDAPQFVLVLAGRWVLLAERERWAEGRYLAVDVQLVAERNEAKRGGEIDRALTCLDAASVAPNPEGDVWWTEVLEASVKHTVGVSQDLRDGVRLSIEIIANEVVRRRRDQGLDPLPGSEAQPLAKQSLRFLYRILFLLYAEASPELGVLPTGAPEYENGYSLDRLRDLVQVQLASPRAQAGTHLYESLGVLFRLVDQGHAATRPDDEESAAQEGLNFHSLRADLFLPKATAHIDEVGLGNAALQEVLTHLLLSKEKRGRDRGFISYAELGINQLGAVYEGLMSYTGFFAETDLYEVAKGGDGSKGSWVVPIDRADGIDAADFVKRTDPLTGQLKPVLHERGTFVFRLAGRERQQSASYYTPEVLTRFTVGQALEELLDQDGTTTTAAEILSLTVCEPALGSGAFGIEAVRQLADQYLKRRQDELGTRIDPDDYPRELQKVKAYLALHNVYGVDLNATAVELAEISLWLDTMVQGLDAPWFGLHLRRGNSLIGARRAVYRRDQVTSKSWLKDVPRDVPMTSLADDVEHGRIGGDTAGGIHHFLLPADGWGATADAKEAAGLVPDAVKALRAWRNGIKAKPSKPQTDALAELAHRVEVLWQFAYQRLRIAESEVRRSIDVWGADDVPEGGAVQREQIEAALADAAGAYQRLRRVMDAWCALWFWPLTDAATTVDTESGPRRVTPPTLDQWIAGIAALLGRSPELRKRSLPGDQTLTSSLDWDGLGVAEQLELEVNGAHRIERVLATHPWLVVCERVAAQHGSFHWELDFVTVFARGGFDLQVGNPPWVQPEFNLTDSVAEHDVALVFEEGRRLDPSTSAPWRSRLSNKQCGLVADDAGLVMATAAFLRAPSNYPELGPASVDLYKSFMESSWRRASAPGRIAFVHSPSIYSEERGARLRKGSYLRLLRFWHFTNERKLFTEIGNRVAFVVSVHRSHIADVKFLSASYLLSADTAIRSMLHDGSGPVPAIKAADGKWDVSPHRRRLRTIDGGILAAWEHSSESGIADSAPFMYLVNDVVDDVLRVLDQNPRISDLVDYGYWYGIGETSGVDDGVIADSWLRAKDPRDAVLQGPHLHVCNPVFQDRGLERRSHRDWSAVDLETLPEAPQWATGYRLVDRDAAEQLVPDWKGVRADSLFRVAWRRRAGAAGARTLMPAILPPEVKHIETIVSIGNPEWSVSTLAVMCGVLSSILSDFQIRITQKPDIRSGVFGRLRFVGPHPTDEWLVSRVLRLNCLNQAYAPIWNEWASIRHPDSWTKPAPVAIAGSESRLESIGPWKRETPLRTDWARRQALLEIDALVAMRLGIGAGQLIDAYRAQFGVWAADDAARSVAPSGRFIRSVESVFAPLDREADMLEAYAQFERRLVERS